MAPKCHHELEKNGDFVCMVVMSKYSEYALPTNKLHNEINLDFY